MDDTATLDELRALRARAYGPSADIGQDPVAARRLEELEAMHGGPALPSAGREASAPEPDAVVSQPEPESEPETRREVAGAADEMEPESVEGPAEPSTSAGGRARAALRVPRRVGWLWVLSLVVTAALAAAITYSLTWIAPVSVSSGAEQIATLEPGPTLSIPDGWFGAGPSSATYEFFGLTLFETANGFNSVGTDCFAVMATDQLPKDDVDPNSWSYEGNIYSGCRVGSFPATVEILVNSNVPEELRDRFPTGSAIQFVFDDGRMGVFLDSE